MITKCCVGNWCSGLGLDIQKPDQQDRFQHWEQQMHPAWCESCSGTASLKHFLDQELNKYEDDENLITVSGTLWIEQYWQPLQPLTKEYKETLADAIDGLTIQSYIAKLKITSSWYSTKPKATAGVKNTSSYILWLYTTWNQMVASNIIHSVLVLMTAAITQAFCTKLKQCLFIILKLITHI